MGGRPAAVQLASLVLTIASFGCSAPDRVAVAWSELVISPDRRTITVTTHYPGGCIKLADGVEIDVRDDHVIVAAFMRRSDDIGPRDDCTAECAAVTQTVTLDEPLPDRPLRPPSNRHLGCQA